MAAMPKGVMVPKRLTTPLQRLREEEIAFTVNSDMMYWAYWGNKLIKREEQKTVNTEVFIELLDSVEISEEQKHRLDALFEKIKGPWKEEVDDDEDFYGRVSRLYEAYDSMINDIKSIVPSKYDHFMYKSLPEDEGFVCACYVFYPRQEQQQQQQVSRVDKIRMQLVEQQLRREPAWLMMVVASTFSVEMAVGGLMFEIQSMFREQPWRKCALGVVAVLDWHLWLFFFVPGKLFPLGTIAMNFDDEKKPQGWPIRNLARLMCFDPVDLGYIDKQAELAAAARAATAAAQQQPLQQPLQPLSSTSSSPERPRSGQ